MSDLMSDDVCRHGVHQNVEALRGRTVKLYQDNMTVVGTLHKMSFKYPELMVEIKNLIPWLPENKIHLEVVYFHSEANLADAESSTGGPCISPHNRTSCNGRVDFGVAGLHRLIYL